MPPPPPLGPPLVPSESRKTHTIRIFQPDELQTYKSKFEIKSFPDVVEFIKHSEEYKDFQFDVSNNNISTYRIVICSGIATVKGCIHIDDNLKGASGEFTIKSNSVMMVAIFLFQIISIGQKDPGSAHWICLQIYPCTVGMLKEPAKQMSLKNCYCYSITIQKEDLHIPLQY